MVNLIWTELALADLGQIHEYIARDSRHYAGRQIEKIMKKVERLKIQPMSGRIVPEFSDPNVRELNEGNYRIIYKVKIEIVFIARIHHSARLLDEL
jgi:addiction module RelE/StbE family toxin